MLESFRPHREINSLRIVVRPHLNQDVTEILAPRYPIGLRIPMSSTGVCNPPKLHAAQGFSLGLLRRDANLIRFTLITIFVKTPLTVTERS